MNNNLLFEGAVVTFNIVETKKRKKDIEKVMDIYLSTIDIESSYTNTNQIKDHILSDTKNENRKLFFYNLYLNSEVFGFAEFGYLQKSETIVLDYICTKKRNHCAFYAFYQLCLEEITKKLTKQKLHIKYIISEISLNQFNGLYCDLDSNYFRKILSMDNFVLLKYPYYQPSFERSPQNFAIAIKSVSSSNMKTSIAWEEYLSLIEDLYTFHYGTWYKKYFDPDEVDKELERLLNTIKKEIAPQKINNISLVNCPVFEAGKCQSINIEPITISKKFKKNLFNILAIIFWLLITIASCLLTFLCDNNLANQLAAIISSISGIITILLYIRGFFRN